MKYLVTYQLTGLEFLDSEQCKYFNDKYKAIEFYKELKHDHFYTDVKFIAIKSKETKTNKVIIVDIFKKGK